ncbi:MAG: hypothetical protein IKU10_00320 [Clostridia bacterium]|nr:hypothetical protein [Clostridia bacterium]
MMQTAQGSLAVTKGLFLSTIVKAEQFAGLPSPASIYYAKKASPVFGTPTPL